MADSPLSRQFLIEASTREIRGCTDVEKLQDVAINLVQQTEALRGVIKELLLRQ